MKIRDEMGAGGGGNGWFSESVMRRVGDGWGNHSFLA